MVQCTVCEVVFDHNVGARIAGVWPEDEDIPPMTLDYALPDQAHLHDHDIAIFNLLNTSTFGIAYYSQSPDPSSARGQIQRSIVVLFTDFKCIGSVKDSLVRHHNRGLREVFLCISRLDTSIPATSLYHLPSLVSQNTYNLMIVWKALYAGAGVLVYADSAWGASSAVLALSNLVSLSQPHPSTPVMHVLECFKGSSFGTIVGTTNPLYVINPRHPIQIVLDLTNQRLSIVDHCLTQCLVLTSADRRFVQSLTTFDSNGILSYFSGVLIVIAQIRGQFALYRTNLEALSLYSPMSTYAHDYNIDFIRIVQPLVGFIDNDEPVESFFVSPKHPFAKQPNDLSMDMLKDLTGPVGAFASDPIPRLRSAVSSGASLAGSLWGSFVSQLELDGSEATRESDSVLQYGIE